MKSGHGTQLLYKDLYTIIVPETLHFSPDWLLCSRYIQRSIRLKSITKLYQNSYIYLKEFRPWRNSISTTTFHKQNCKCCNFWNVPLRSRYGWGKSLKIITVIYMLCNSNHYHLQILERLLKYNPFFKSISLYFHWNVIDCSSENYTNYSATKCHTPVMPLLGITE